MDFTKNGCPDGEGVMQRSTDCISVFTTAYFDRIIAIVNPESTSVPRWQRTWIPRCRCSVLNRKLQIG
ncbi:hypothetical protein EDC04DRAFT_2790158, partial [Pisolithus marmoratus]